MKHSILIALVLVFVLGATTARAEYRDPRYSAGTWSLALYPYYMVDLSNRHVQMGGGSVDVGYYFDQDMAINLQVSGFYVQQDGEDTAAGSIGVLGRHHIFTYETWSFLLDVGGGLVEAGRDVPPDGTQFNYYFRFGPGMTFELDERMQLLTGIRYYHMSNASREGEDRNPSVNGAEVYIGVLLAL